VSPRSAIIGLLMTWKLLPTAPSSAFSMSARI
jgi:hypothetical protein